LSNSKFPICNTSSSFFTYSIFYFSAVQFTCFNLKLLKLSISHLPFSISNTPITHFRIPMFQFNSSTSKHSYYFCKHRELRRHLLSQARLQTRNPFTNTLGRLLHEHQNKANHERRSCEYFFWHTWLLFTVINTSFSFRFKNKGKKPLFVQFILENIWQIYDSVYIRK